MYVCEMVTYLSTHMYGFLCIYMHVWEDQTVTVNWYINLVVNRFIQQ